MNTGVASNSSSLLAGLYSELNEFATMLSSSEDIFVLVFFSDILSEALEGDLPTYFLTERDFWAGDFSATRFLAEYWWDGALSEFVLDVDCSVFFAAVFRDLDLDLDLDRSVFCASDFPDLDLERSVFSADDFTDLDRDLERSFFLGLPGLDLALDCSGFLTVVWTLWLYKQLH